MPSGVILMEDGLDLQRCDGSYSFNNAGPGDTLAQLSSGPGGGGTFASTEFEHTADLADGAVCPLPLREAHRA